MRAHSRAETTRWQGSDPKPAALWWARNQNRADSEDALPLPPPPSPPPPHFGPYLLRDQIGTGGLSTVYRVLDSRAVRLGCETPLALKRLHAGFGEDWELVEAFLQEAKLSSQLRHPHIARTYQSGKLDGTYFAIMELVAGPTLADVITQCRSAAGAMPVGVVVELMIQLCDALDHLHSASPAIVHRDVIPQNMIVASSGRLKLIDLGVAKTAGRRRTRRGIVKGTLAYAAPETLDGILDARGDLFAVGVLAHELLVGRPLFAASSDGATIRNLRDKPVHAPSRWAPEVPFDLDDIVLTALHRDPDRRWQNAAALRFALTTLATEMGGRLGLAQHLRDWLDWAFQCEPRNDSRKVRRLVASLERDLVVAL